MSSNLTGKELAALEGGWVETPFSLLVFLFLGFLNKLSTEKKPDGC